MSVLWIYDQRLFVIWSSIQFHISNACSFLFNNSTIVRLLLNGTTIGLVWSLMFILCLVSLSSSSSSFSSSYHQTVFFGGRAFFHLSYNWNEERKTNGYRNNKTWWIFIDHQRRKKERRKKKPLNKIRTASLRLIIRLRVCIYIVYVLSLPFLFCCSWNSSHKISLFFFLQTKPTKTFIHPSIHSSIRIYPFI